MNRNGPELYKQLVSPQRRFRMTHLIPVAARLKRQDDGR
jgi:hypothetical protein